MDYGMYYQYQVAVNYVNNLLKKNYKGNVAKSLAEYAYKKGSYDNITVVLLYLQ